MGAVFVLPEQKIPCTRAAADKAERKYFSMFIKIAMIVVFFAALIVVGVISRRSSRGVDGFVLGGRSVGPWLTAFSFGTSYFSAVIFIGYAGRFGWNFGLASTWIGLGNAFIGSLLAWVVLGRRTRVMTQHLGSRTMPDFFGLRFSSRALRLCSAVIVFVFLIPYTASLFNGLSSLFSTAFSGIGYIWWVLIMAVLTGIYVIIGGYMGAAVNNFIQGMIMLVGIVAVIGAVLSDQGGMSEAIARLSADSVTTAGGTTFSGAFVSFLGPQPLQLLGVVILTSLGTWGLPQMVGKFYAIKDEGAIHKGTIISTAFALVVAGGCYFLGGFGRLFANEIALTESGAPQSFDNIIPTMLDAVTNRLGVRGDWLMGLVLILVLSASMSTLASLVMTSASTIALDLVAVVRKKRAVRESRDMLLMRVLIAISIAIAAAIAILAAYNKEMAGRLYISDLMGISWGTLAGCFLAPFMYGLFSKKITRAAVWASFATGLGITMTEFVLTSVLGIHFENAFMAYLFNSAINAGMLAMITGLIIVPIVSLLTRKRTPENVEEMFACYNRTVTVPVSSSLSEED